MIPMELKFDKEGLLYYDNPNLIMERPLDIGDPYSEQNDYYNYVFYKLPSTDDYIVKYCSTIYSRREIKAFKEMLKRLIMVQNNVERTDFPIGYYSSLNKKLSGLIIKNYKDALSLDKIAENHDINALNKYYYHDDDSLHNLFLLFLDVLESLKEMHDNNILYFDSNPGNVVLADNMAKIIDFDYRFIKFEKNDTRDSVLYTNFILFVKSLLKSYDIDEKVNAYYSNYYDTKEYVKKLEKSIRNR